MTCALPYELQFKDPLNEEEDGPPCVTFYQVRPKPCFLEAHFFYMAAADLTAATGLAC